ncbi:MAG: hypothetical protein JSU07_12370 [Bacteroidetes bacterium]|nr:hypothetical protein [Bacteroidota bacterium]
MATKAVFDNIEMKLIVMDKFGNITQIEIRNFKLFIKEKSATKEFESFSNNLTQDMLTHLNKLKKSTKLFFTNIYVEEHEHLEKLPDVIEIWFPVCK